MPTRQFAMIIGAVFLIVGILGFIPAFVTAPPVGAHDLAVDAGHGYLFGLFPINVLHNIVHLGVGVIGLAMSRTVPSAVRFCRGLAIFYGLLAVMGIFPVLRTTFGLIPIHGHDVWLHAVTAIAAGYFGFVRHDAPTSVTGRRTQQPAF